MRRIQIDSQPDETRNQGGDTGLREGSEAIAAPVAADGFEGPSHPDLDRVLAAWKDLPGPVRVRILAMAEATAPPNSPLNHPNGIDG